MGETLFSFKERNKNTSAVTTYEYKLSGSSELVESVTTPFTFSDRDFYRIACKFRHPYNPSTGGDRYGFAAYVIASDPQQPNCNIDLYKNGDYDSTVATLGTENAEGQHSSANSSGTSYGHVRGSTIYEYYDFYINPKFKVFDYDDSDAFLAYVTYPGASLKVSYAVPQNTYEYIKLVYKQGKIPADVTDGTVIDLDPSETEVTVSGIEGEIGTVYYFVIFTDKSVGDEYVYEIGRVWDGSETTLLWSGDNNKLTAKIDNSHIVFTFYSGDTVIYSFNSAVGTAVADIGKIYVSFLIDHDFQVAKPSFIYNNGDSTYSYNQETPTDSQMADLYTWVNAGLGG